jgi:crotonobetainyl-CoA:carnitine CoA-transferase CaiB-like acyl-CoA transferase
VQSRNKKCVTLNLREARGQELLLKLAAQADALVENFRPGTLEKWGLGPDQLWEVNPGLVIARISGYGQTGPYASRPGFGRIAQAFGGLTLLAGYPDRPPVLPGSATLADYAAGLFGAIGVLAALQHRQRTGQGQQIDISLFESIFRFTDFLPLAYDLLGTVRERVGTQAHAAPHNHYPTADGKWIAIACTSDRLFYRLAAAMHDPAWADDPEFQRMEQRAARRVEVDARVTAWTAQHLLAELQAALDAAEVPNSPIYSIADIFEDPQYRARETLTTIDDPVLGPVRMPAPVPRLSETPARISRPAPEIGEHNAEVYGDLLGLGEAELAKLRAASVI